jgi:uncharacterized protein (DUF1330 family)
MSAYVVVDVQVTNPLVFEEYKKLSSKTIAQYGGKYLARGGSTEILEGNWAPNRLVIIEFESVVQARIWYNSPEYQTARESRALSADGNLLIVEGCPPPVY